ncbi:MAG: hypothetical protein PVJ57_14580 [Phycisphaerae bacterium]|jgi:rod shape-determining protein MreD
MTWLGLLAALLVSLVLQTGLHWLGLASPYGVDLLLALALIYGLAAPLAEARLAGWIIGFGVDLMTEGPLGAHAFALGLTAYFLTVLRERVNGTLWWIRLAICFLAALPGQVLLGLHLRYVLDATGAGLGGLLVSALVLSLTGALVAALATFIVPLAQRHGMHGPSWSRG